MPRWASWTIAVSILLVLLMVGGGALGLFFALRQMHVGVWSMGTMNMVGLALINYNEQNGDYPPRVLTIELEDGTRLEHSWRVVILPQLGEGESYAKYDFQKPWNHSENIAAMKKMEFGKILGYGADWTPYIALSDFDDHANEWKNRERRPMIVYCPEARIAWAEPRDVTLSEYQRIVGQSKPRAAVHWNVRQSGIEVSFPYDPHGDKP